MTPALPPTIAHLAQQAAADYGDAPAIYDQGENWSYAQLWQRAREAASAFLAHGISKGDRIAVWAPNNREWIVAALGALACGAAIVPLNTRLKGREAGDILRRTRAKLLICAQEFLGVNYPQLLQAENLPDLQKIITIEFDWQNFLDLGCGADDPGIERVLRTVSAEDVSDIMFTSGTTGAPKGVLTTHSRILPMFWNWTDLVDLRAGDSYLIVNPFFHSFGFKAGWVAALLRGARIVPMASFDVKKTIAHIEKDGIAFLPGPPTIYQSLLAELGGRPLQNSKLRSAITGAATVPPILIERMQKELGIARVLTAYGMTECSNITACRAGDDINLIANSCGKAIPGLEVKCIDDSGQDLPAGHEGEIVVRGYGVMLGYLDDEKSTREAIDKNGWLHTGDVGVLDENGYLRITDRKKDMYITGGFNCYPAEIEKLLANHQHIEMVAVIGIPDERMGEVGKAFIVPRPGASPSADGIIAWARENMANYKVPRAVEFVTDLPRNASGKVMKTELRRP